MRWSESGIETELPKNRPLKRHASPSLIFTLRCGEQTKAWLWTSSGPQPDTWEAQFVSVDHPFMVA